MRRFVPVFIAAALLATLLATPSSARASALQIKVLSNRADLISGGDALVEVVLPKGASKATVKVGGRDVTRAFARRAQMGGRFVGLVTGLRLGMNRLTARAGGTVAAITITNHRSGGPVFSGPQVWPWACAPGSRDRHCTRPPVYTYMYKPAAPFDCIWLLGNINACTFRPYDPEDPPPAENIAMTTTDQGVTVPYIVRVETGTINRDQYRIGVLFDPAKSWTAWSPQKPWNHKVVVTGGAGCGVGYTEANAPDVLQDAALSHGFAVMSHALDNAGHNCGTVGEAESLMMTKERLVERYGEIRYTIGSGCSGGSLMQQQVANAYPGIFDGITPACSYPDFSHRATWVIDFALLSRYYTDPTLWSPGVAWTPSSMAAVNGNPYPPQGNTMLFDPTGGGDCPGVPAEQLYNAQSNPKGVRCTYQDYLVSVFGRRPRSVWTPAEKAAGRGFANRPLDNVGIQYGLKALMAGQITPAQFVDLNAKIGSFDLDVSWQQRRAQADSASLPTLYKGGLVMTGRHLDKVPILDIRGPSEGYHEGYRTYVTRARLDREVGSHANQVTWRGATVPIGGDIRHESQAILAMDEWLAAIERDKRNIPLPRKIVLNKPKTLVDRCNSGAGNEIPPAVCDATVKNFSSPRIEAGMPFTDDVMKCRLRPMRRSDYFPALFSDAQWSTLRKTFPSGVCDFSKPGVGYQKTVAWITYERGPGGRPLPAPPRSRIVAGG